MKQGRARVLAIMTAILAAPRLEDWCWDGRTGAPACKRFAMNAAGVAERIMTIIDREHDS